MPFKFSYKDFNYIKNVIIISLYFSLLFHTSFILNSFYRYLVTGNYFYCQQEPVHGYSANWNFYRLWKYQQKILVNRNSRFRMRISSLSNKSFPKETMHRYDFLIIYLVFESDLIWCLIFWTFLPIKEDGRFSIVLSIDSIVECNRLYYRWYYK